MLEAEKAAFSFQSFRVPKFTFDEGNNDLDNKLTLGFLPSGIYNSKTGEFEVTIKFVSQVENQERNIFELTAVSLFKFNTPIPYSEIPSFFYKNAIAIIFPYIRAFISTLTLQANTKLLKLDLMNLSVLEKPLIDNTTVI